jgi:tryptophan-rich sensory protein
MDSPSFESTLGKDGMSSDKTFAAQGHQRGGPRRFRQEWAIALACGAAAGLGSWFAGERAHVAYKPRMFVVQVLSLTALEPSRESQRDADLKNATLVYAIQGALMGLAMGYAGGLVVRSPVRGLKVGLLALVAGGLVGAVASLALVPFFYRQLIPDTNDLLSPVLIHGGIWTAIGAVGGIAFAIAMRESKRRSADAVAGACFGAVLATIFFHALAAAVFPDSQSTQAVADTTIVRLMAMSLVSVLVAIGAAWGALGGFVVRNDAEA